ncbi:MAG: NAD(P)-binding protein, partial [Candidatus Wildermuthbacteria bacterium]|nr:NAD(P)-binding protein [Candidatus Wildermuthbacteria bacterium]
MKVAIIGAGICGLYLARKLAERGEDATVFEKKNKIGKEVCSGLFSERILEFVPESRDLIQNQINYTLIHFPHRTLKIRFSKKFLVMNHAALDRLVASLAEKSGAKILLNSPKTVLELSHDFERIIGCDGALSKTREILKLEKPEFYLGIQGMEGSMKFPSSPPSLSLRESSVVEAWPTQNGFIWKIPRGRNVEWGIMERPDSANKIFYDFLAKNNIRLENQQAWLIPQGLVIPRNDEITLIGDAAGLTKPWSGGGVIWGLTAADILLKNFP